MASPTIQAMTRSTNTTLQVSPPVSSPATTLVNHSHTAGCAQEHHSTFLTLRPLRPSASCVVGRELCLQSLSLSMADTHSHGSGISNSQHCRITTTFRAWLLLLSNPAPKYCNEAERDACSSTSYRLVLLAVLRSIRSRADIQCWFALT